MKAFLAIFSLLLIVVGIIVGGIFFVFSKEGETQQDKSTSSPAATMGSFVKAPPMAAPSEENFSEVVEAVAKAMKKFPDAVAWLQIPETKVNNLVMQGHDNSKYLRKDENGNDSVYGCYFADYACCFEDSSKLLPNTVIYGHSDLKDNPEGKRFSQLFKFTDENFAKQNRMIFLTTPNQQMKWEIFSVFYTDTNFDYINPEITPEIMKAVADEAMKRSLYEYGVTVREEDKILTLSTCSIKLGKDREDIRFVVMARLLKEGEAPSESFYQNKNPKQPQ